MEAHLITPGDSPERPQKRMRKGTHSCTECRRRKIRCKFLSEENICVGCSERATKCVSQGIPIATRHSSARGVAQTPQSLIGSGTSDIATSSGPNPPIISVLGRRMDSSSPAPSRPESLNICEVLRKRLPSYDTVIVALERYGAWWESFRQKTRVVTQAEPVEQLQTFAAQAYTSSSAGKLGLLVVAYARSIGPGRDDHSLLSLVDQLVISDPSVVGSLDGTECLVLLAKTYTDIGQPRRAWLTWRKGLAIAQLLGLHKAASSKDVRQRLWLAIYHGDRFTSLLLGLPHGFSDSHLLDTVTLSVGSTTTSFEAWVTQFIHDCAVIAGQVIESILSPANPSFATAMQLDERLGKMYNSAPQGWWDIPATEVWNQGGAEVAPLVDKLLVHFFFFHVRLYTHLPFLQSSSSASSPVCSVSRVACRDAAQSLLRRFLPLCIDISGVRVFDCKTSDFVGFTAAVALLLGRGDSNELYDGAKEDEELLERVREVFQRQGQGGCKIAAQCATALSRLSRPTWDEAATDVFVPYFGKVTLSRRTVSHGEGEGGHMATPAHSGSTFTDTTCVPSGTEITPVNDLEYMYSGYPVQNAGVGSWEGQAGSFQGLDFMSLDIDQDWSLFLDSM